MINVYNMHGELVGQITEQQFDFLHENLEEESLEDQDYALNSMVIDYMEGEGGDPQLIALLRKVLASNDEVIIRWSRS